MPGYDYSPVIKMRDYKYDYRTLNAWECFEAEGKFCHDKNHKSMVLATGSSNYGHGICCKPNYSEGICHEESSHICSQPVSYQETSSEFKNILTDGKENHQLFAFLPKPSFHKCGIKENKI